MNDFINIGIKGESQQKSDAFGPIVSGLACAVILYMIVWWYRVSTILRPQSGNPDKGRWIERKRNAEKAARKKALAALKKQQFIDSRKVLKNQSGLEFPKFDWHSLISEISDSFNESTSSSGVTTPVDFVEMPVPVVSSARRRFGFQPKHPNCAFPWPRDSPVEGVEKEEIKKDGWTFKRAPECAVILQKLWKDIMNMFTEFVYFGAELWDMVPIFDPVEWMSGIKDSEMYKDGYLFLQMLVTFEFMKEVKYVWKGYNVLEVPPLHKPPTMFEFTLQGLKILKRIGQIIYTAIVRRSLRNVFSKDAVSGYDEEFSYLASQITCVNIGRGDVVANAAYDRRLHECIEQSVMFMNKCKPAERAYYASKLTALQQLQVQRTLAQKESMREMPYGVLLYGASSVGKSSVAQSLIRYILRVNGKDASDRSIIVLNPEDAFQSELMSHHKGILLDDLCNSNLKYVKTNPISLIVQLFNQVPQAALSPIAEMKGKVMMEPDVVLGTTNVKELKANELSHEPLSVLRRFQCIITQKAKPEYCKPGTEMLDPAKIEHMFEQQFPTFGLFTIEEALYKEVRTGNTRGGAGKMPGEMLAIGFRPLLHKGLPLVDVEMPVMLEFLKEHSADHFHRQKLFVSSQKSRKECSLCEHLNPVEFCQECDPITSDEMILENQMSLPYYKEVCVFLWALETRFIAIMEIFARAMVNTSWGETVVVYIARKYVWEYAQKPLSYLAVIFAMLMLLACGGHFHYGLAIALLVGYGIYVAMVFYYVRLRVIKTITTCPRPSEWVSNNKALVLRSTISFLTTYGLWKLITKMATVWYHMKVVQSAAPISFQVNEKERAQGTEFWDKKSVEHKYLVDVDAVSEASATITSERLQALIGSKLMFLKKDVSGEVCNAVPIKSNVMLIPWHIVPELTDFVTLTTAQGRVFKKVPLSQDICFRIEGTDLAVWYTPSIGPQKDLTCYLPEHLLIDKMIYVTPVYNQGGMIRTFDEFVATRGRVITTSCVYDGLNYRFPVETFGGLCMAALIGSTRDRSQTRLPFIAGFHLAGSGHRGAAGFVTRTQIVNAIATLDARPAIYVSLSAPKFDTEQMGVNFGPFTPAHDKCTTKCLDPDTGVLVHGGHAIPRGTQKSAVVVSLISKSVTEIMGIERKHGPPKEIGHKRHKILNISTRASPADSFETKYVQQAYSDFEEHFKKLPLVELQQLGKISDPANLAGLDGVLGINGINCSTALGFPLNGPKSKLIKISDVAVEGITRPLEIDPLVWKEVAKMEKVLLSGQRIHTVFKAALKDEPVALDKDKVRVFSGANVAFVLLVRKYYLSLAAMIQRNRVLSECAVGIVVQSPEWGELFNHIGRFGWNRAIAGDYSSYDTRMSAHFILMSFKLMTTLAERSGNYDTDDLFIMRGIATEISCPVHDWFGTIVEFTGSNPSGHPLTVIVNSLANSLYMRYTYYAIADKRKWPVVPPFADVVALQTYGDDNISTVKQGFDDYNHTAIANEFLLVDMKYTMADKDAVSVPFIKLENASFLKHFAKWDPDLGVYRSPTEPNSLAKMLHSHKRSAILTMEESSAEAIKNCALKYFEFGEKEYTKRVAELMLVAKQNRLEGIVGDLATYPEMVSWYREKFDLPVPRSSRPSQSL